MTDTALVRLQDPAPLGLTELLQLWRGQAAGGSEAAPLVPCLLVERALQAGEPLVAYDWALEALEQWPRDVRLRQLLGLALARSGASRRAQEVLATLVAEGHRDQETLGLFARTNKDLWEQATDPAAAEAHLQQAAEGYEAAYEQHGAPWLGINAATTAQLLGDVDRARRLARKVRAQCVSRPAGEGDAYWTQATLGEAAILLGEWAEAEAHYREAERLGHGRLADLATTRRQASRLIRHLGRDPGWLDECCRPPRVVTFSGHMIDRPGRAWPRFPPALEGGVARGIAERLDRLNAGIGYASAACGSDILFLEAMLARGGEIHVVLPFSPAEFRATSVEIAPGDWTTRFDRVLARAAEVVVAGELGLAAQNVLYEYGNLLTDGLALLHGQVIGADPARLAVWDGRAGDAAGGTHSRIEAWQRQGRAYERIDPSVLASPAGSVLAPAPAATGPPRASERDPVAPDQRIMAMLFADAVGFSKLTEGAIPAFVRHFLGGIGALVTGSPHAPLFRNTWGDGLFFVFASVRDATRFALELSQHLASLDLPALGLPPSLSLRIGLHAGPVYVFSDPVTGATNYFGAHVSRAARIEPITPPGHVYASQSFAAIAAAEQVSAEGRSTRGPGHRDGSSGVHFDYVGRIPLAKGYGSFPMYHVRAGG